MKTPHKHFHFIGIGFSWDNRQQKLKKYIFIGLCFGHPDLLIKNEE